MAKNLNTVSTHWFSAPRPSVGCVIMMACRNSCSNIIIVIWRREVKTRSHQESAFLRSTAAVSTVDDERSCTVDWHIFIYSMQKCVIVKFSWSYQHRLNHSQINYVMLQSVPKCWDSNGNLSKDGKSSIGGRRSGIKVASCSINLLPPLFFIHLRSSEN